MIKELSQTAVPTTEEVYLTERQVRAIINESLQNLTGTVRMLSGEITNQAGNVSITPLGTTLTALASGSLLNIQGWTFSGTFSASDSDTVAWTAGTLTFGDGTTYSISAGNTGNIAALTYIYFDAATSATVLQTTTTASTSVGANKVLLCTAKNESGKNATFQAFNSKGVGTLITADNIAAGTITTNEIAANTIIAGDIAAGTITGDQIAASISLTSPSITGGKITAGGDVILGDYDGTHRGLLVGTPASFNNIFIKRSDGVIFFRINQGGTHSLTFDSSSGILALRGQLNADDIIAGTITGRTLQIIGAEKNVKVDSASGYIRWGYNGTYNCRIEGVDASTLSLVASNNINTYCDSHDVYYEQDNDGADILKSSA